MIWYALRKLGAFALTVLVAAQLVDLLLKLAPSELAPNDGFLAWLFAPGSTATGAALAVTVPLIVLALLIAAGLGLGIGVWVARRPGSLVDKSLLILTEIGVATANFWLGMLLVLLFSVTLRWLPAGGFVPWQESPIGALGSLILPALALALPQAAVLARLVRLALIDAATSSYVLAAQGRGLTAREAMRRHGFRNAGLALAKGLKAPLLALIGGALIVENVFYLSGLGRLLFDAVAARDLVTVRAAALVLILGLAGTVLLLQLCAGWADPRIREGHGA